jgi:hypothetical protein
MRKLAIFFLLLIFFITGSNDSMQMFSLEQGSVHTENYNLYHVLSNLPTDIYINCERHKNSLTSRKDKHAHVILPNSISRNKGDIITYLKNQIPQAATFPRQFYSYSSISANTLLPPLIFRFLSSAHHNFLQSTVLLV